MVRVKVVCQAVRVHCMHIQVHMFFGQQTGLRTDRRGLRANSGATLLRWKRMHEGSTRHLVDIMKPRSAVDVNFDTACGRTFHSMKRVMSQ